MRIRLSKRSKIIIGSILAVLVIALIAARIYLGVWLLGYVNKTLANIDGYHGSVEDIDIALYRGAYRIHNLKITKKNGNIPAPFVDIKTIDLSLQWSALFRGRIVSDIDLDAPVLTFAKSPSGTVTQTGREVDWDKPIRDLMPIDINVVTFKNGKISYRDFSSTPKVNVYINDMNGELRNLRNVADATTHLPSKVIINGDSIGNGKLMIRGNMNVLKSIPDMDIDLKLENANLVALTDYSNAYAAIDIKKGTLSVYSELIIKNNRVSGYVKPIASNISLIDLRKTNNPLKLLWESVSAVVVTIFTNQSTDQFATQIPLEGSLDNIDTNVWSAVGGIIRNAFIDALEKGVDGSAKF